VHKIIHKSIRDGQVLDMIYMTNERTFTKRWIKVYRLQGESFKAYCFLRKSIRTFKLANVLALVPVEKKASVDV